MGILIFIAIVTISVVLFLNALVIVKPYHFVVPNVLGSRGRGKRSVLREGPHLIVPLISSVEDVSMELVKKDIKFSFVSKDGWEIGVEGVFQYRPDPDVLFFKGHPDEGRNVFVTVSEEVILAGVVESVEARIGGIGGKHEHGVFIQSRPALGDIVNSILRLAKPPHIMHKHGEDSPNSADSHSWSDPNWGFCGRGNTCIFTEPVNAERLIEFYNFHWPEIRIIKSNENILRKNRSEIELRYGIDVETFDLGNIIFSKESQEALEKEKQAEARAKAANKRIEVAKRYVDEVGTSPQTAVDESDLLMDSTIKKNIVSIQGEAGILGGILGAFTKKGGT